MAAVGVQHGARAHVRRQDALHLHAVPSRQPRAADRHRRVHGTQAARPHGVPRRRGPPAQVLAMPSQHRHAGAQVLGRPPGDELAPRLGTGDRDRQGVLGAGERATSSPLRRGANSTAKARAFSSNGSAGPRHAPHSASCCMGDGRARVQKRFVGEMKI